jgi:hypothetical protein
MRLVGILILGLSVTFVAARAQCTISFPPDAVGTTPLWFSADTQRATLWSCHGDDCSERMAEEPIAGFSGALVDEVRKQVSTLETMASCLEGDLIQQDDWIKQLGTLGDDEKTRLVALHVVTLRQVGEVRARLNTVTAEWGPFGRKLGKEPIEVWLSPTSHPWLRRMVLTAFGLP